MKTDRMARKNTYEETTPQRKMNMTSVIILLMRICFLLVALVVVIRIVDIQFFWKPDPVTYKYFAPQSRSKDMDPVRGSILARDGRILASATPMYRIEMDCSVRKAEFAADGEKGAQKEAEWRSKAQKLSEGLASLIGGKSAGEYYRDIIAKRLAGSTSYKIADQVDHETLLALKELPLFNEISYKGGLIYTKIDTRQYPYGSLARRTIGYVKNNREARNNSIGLEGKFNEVLHGKDGHKWMKVTDGHERIPDMDSAVVKVVDGNDIRTTLDVDIQNIADRAMRKFFLDSRSSEKIVEGGCIVMDVKTGAIRAMVNLRKDEDGNVTESYNYMVGRKGEPGSVFKAVTVMTLLEDGKLKSLADSVPTFGGVWTYAGKTFRDTEHLNKQRFPEGVIRVEDALMISCNNVFRYLAATNYDSDPDGYMKKIRKYGFLDSLDFDLDGLGGTKLPTIDKKQRWTYQDLAQLGMGYAVELTPLHILTLYNGIANGGKLMKPYLVEDVEKNGNVIKKYGPKVLNSSMCKKSTVDTLTRGLLKVTQGWESERNYGTAYYPFKGCKCNVAGKTGTARRPVDNPDPSDPYLSRDGRRKFQATFVGFFPVEDPQYSIVTVVYSKPIIGNMYGSACAEVSRDIINEIYCLDSRWGEEYKSKGSIPKMAAGKPATAREAGRIPDVKGMGLMDAIYAIENSGYVCSYEGTGHVTRQDPPAGAKYGSGATVRIALK